ncbi:unnamed protein product [Gongylonema pulchrum]|uniref:Ovule protein n=1 Tax=Gongylonema pulchrum TaxID=637853 RepID=A0A183ENE9_9BILA|nr:unnamed protein product [Gongylonema pulchrum]
MANERIFVQMAAHMLVQPVRMSERSRAPRKSTNVCRFLHLSIGSVIVIIIADGFSARTCLYTVADSSSDKIVFSPTLIVFSLM